MDKPPVSSIPLTPGVYLYKDTHGHIIYVGKARCLRKRVFSYFGEPHRLTAKTRAMLANAATIDTISTGTEKEALLLEASLIKKHKPHYNIVLRDDKQYVLFRLGIAERFPRLQIVRRAAADGARYFGPFTSAMAAREAWRGIHRIFPLRRCSDRVMGSRVRPCLYHDIGQCPAPCVGLAVSSVYAETVRHVEMFLAGRSKELIDLLSEEMKNLAMDMEYERAAVLRDRIRALKATVERQSVVFENGGEMDVAAVADVGNGLGLGLLFIREGKLMDGRSLFWPELGAEDVPELLWSFLGQYYASDAGRVPARLIIPESVVGVPKDGDDSDSVAREVLEAVLSDLRGDMVTVRPPKGPAERAVFDMAMANAREAVRKDSDVIGRRLAAAFHARQDIRTVACVDVSHTGGAQTRVGVVFFENGNPLKSAYRSYSIEGTCGDDYAALAVWARRYAERRATGEEAWPDLILIDGGRGQVASVARAFAEAGLLAGVGGELPFILAGIAKARDASGHADRRAGNVADRIFPAGRSNPLPIREGAPELLFLQRVRDEAHRFAIGRHRLARSRQSLTGALLAIPGIGPVTARRLWDAFGTLDAITSATVEAIAAVPGIGPRQAENLSERLAVLRGTMS